MLCHVVVGGWRPRGVNPRANTERSAGLSQRAMVLERLPRGRWVSRSSPMACALAIAASGRLPPHERPRTPLIC